MRLTLSLLIAAATHSRLALAQSDDFNLFAGTDAQDAVVDSEPASLDYTLSGGQP
jgi:hypothetical protein